MYVKSQDHFSFVTRCKRIPPTQCNGIVTNLIHQGCRILLLKKILVVILFETETSIQHNLKYKYIGNRDTVVTALWWAVTSLPATTAGLLGPAHCQPRKVQSISPGHSKQLIRRWGNHVSTLHLDRYDCHEDLSQN